MSGYWFWNRCVRKGVGNFEPKF